MDAAWFFLVILRASVLSVGGQNSLPLVREGLVPSGLVTDDQLVQAIVIGRVAAGPNGLYVVSVGYLAFGWIGGLLALAASMLPPLIILPFATAIRRRRSQPWVDGLLRGVALVTSGLTLATSAVVLGPFDLADPATLWQLALVGAGFLVGLHGRWSPIPLLGAAAAVGVVLGG